MPRRHFYQAKGAVALQKMAPLECFCWKCNKNRWERMDNKTYQWFLSDFFPVLFALWKKPKNLVVLEGNDNEGRYDIIFTDLHFCRKWHWKYNTLFIEFLYAKRDMFLNCSSFPHIRQNILSSVNKFHICL